MDGSNQRFMNGGAAWLANHLIVYGVNKTGGSDNPFGQGIGTIGTELPVHDFDLRKIGDIMNQGNAAKAYELRKLTETIGSGKATKARKITGSTNEIQAYFLPWGRGSTFRGQLGVNADYFFTPTLNGCTFAHTGAGPNPSVAHSNFVDPLTTMADQNAMNADLTNVFGGGMPPNTLIKATYKHPAVGLEDFKATVVGIRTGNTWNFYYQNYKVDLVQGNLVNSGVSMCVQI